ncbi:hypothetical protein [Dipodfec virus RodF1_16]|uniref:Uncharacterized protein n=1 Tax=Dipodfec virus RodF1_16 TaxID=2929292 RepID=A0A976R8F0_9VIRU|nr:hypothetical protein [Dipodfec virus RodF1_16]
MDSKNFVVIFDSDTEQVIPFYSSSYTTKSLSFKLIATWFALNKNRLKCIYIFDSNSHIAPLTIYAKSINSHQEISFFNSSINLKLYPMYVVTLFDSRSTQENPIKPITAVVDSKGLSEVLSKAVDEHHYIVVNLANDINSILTSE